MSTETVGTLSKKVQQEERGDNTNISLRWQHIVDTVREISEMVFNESDYKSSN